MSEEHQVRGNHIVPLRDFIFSRYDETTQGRILRGLSETTRTTLPELRPDSWFSNRVPNDLVASIFSAQDTAERGYQEVIDAGQAIAEYGVNTFMRLLIKLMTPEMLAKKWPTIWAKGHNFGHMDTDLSMVKDQRLTLTLREVESYAHLGPIAVGFLQYTLFAMGRREAKVVQQDVDYSLKLSPTYTYEVTW